MKITLFGFEIGFCEPSMRDTPTVAECIIHELSKPKNAGVRDSFARHSVNVGDISPTFLGPEYDDVKFGSHEDAARGEGAWRVVDGKFCSTVGEYREALDKKYPCGGL